jgi:AP2-associated kinase
VRSLLDDSQKSGVTTTRTAEGYGHYTEKPLPARPGTTQEQNVIRQAPPAVARKPVPMQAPSADIAYAKTRPLTTSSAPAAALRTSTGPQTAQMRPSAPPKPKALRTGGPGEYGSNSRPSSSSGAAARPGLGAPPAVRGGGAGPEEAEFDVDSFSKRYPSLSGLEMVETVIPPGLAPGRRGGVRDV